MRDSVPSARYSSVCNVLRQWSISLIPTYRVSMIIFFDLYVVYRCTLVLCFLYTFTAAAYTYYHSLNQEESLKQRGKQDDRKRVRRRRERLLRVGSFVV